MQYLGNAIELSAIKCGMPVIIILEEWIFGSSKSLLSLPVAARLSAFFTNTVVVKPLFSMATVKLDRGGWD